jgi:hypothetical protein
MFGKAEDGVEKESRESIAKIVPDRPHYFPRIDFPRTTKVSNVNRKTTPVAMYRSMS